MGASESRDESLQIYITLDKPFYYAGDHVQGVIRAEFHN